MQQQQGLGLPLLRNIATEHYNRILLQIIETQIIAINTYHWVCYEEFPFFAEYCFRIFVHNITEEFCYRISIKYTPTKYCYCLRTRSLGVPGNTISRDSPFHRIFPSAARCTALAPSYTPSLPPPPPPCPHQHSQPHTYPRPISPHNNSNWGQKLGRGV